MWHAEALKNGKRGKTMMTDKETRTETEAETALQAKQNKAPRPLRQELKSYFGRVIVAMAILLVLIISIIIRLWNTNRDTINEVKYGAELYKMEVAHYKWVSSLEMALDYGQEFDGELDPDQCTLGQFLNDEANNQDPDRKEFIDSVRELHEQVHASAQQILDLPDSEKEQKQEIFLNTTLPSVEKLIESLSAEIDAGMQRVVSDQREFVLLLVIGGIVCFICIAFAVHGIGDIYRFFDRQITKVLENISGKAEKLAEGQLELTFDCDSSVEELVTLRDSMQFAVQELGRYVNAISEGMGEFEKGNLAAQSSITFLGDFAPIENSIDAFADNISGVLSRVEESANAVADSSDQIAKAVQELAESTTSQAQSVQVLLEKSEHVTESVQATAQSIQEVNHLIKDAEGIVGTQKVQMNSVSDAMDIISKRSEEIRAISDTVKNIANQTNLLSLNASIEAARAGTAGKGFAVVADNIKNLAAESAAATEKIQNLIAATIDAVQNGDKKIKETAGTLEEIVKVTKGIAKKATEVSDNAQQESDAIIQIKDETGKINEMVLNSSAVSEENAAASTELANQAQTLKELTEHFTVRK